MKQNNIDHVVIIGSAMAGGASGAVLDVLAGSPSMVTGISTLIGGYTVGMTAAIVTALRGIPESYLKKRKTMRKMMLAAIVSGTLVTTGRYMEAQIGANKSVRLGEEGTNQVMYIEKRNETDKFYKYGEKFLPREEILKIEAYNKLQNQNSLDNSVK